MKLKIFSVYDSKIEAYMQPFFMQSKGAALRAFMDTLADKSSVLAKHPEDYTLFEIGEFDDTNCTIATLPAKLSLGLAKELIKE